MAKIIQGERIAKKSELRVGSCAVIFDETRERILLTRRKDNGQWCLPGGGMHPGESAEETCIRETLEETGLDVRPTRLIGVYSSPDVVVEYGDGNRWQLVSMSFEAEIISGQLGLSDETTDFGYFTRDEIERLDVMQNHIVRIADAWAAQEQTFVR